MSRNIASLFWGIRVRLKLANKKWGHQGSIIKSEFGKYFTTVDKFLDFGQTQKNQRLKLESFMPKGLPFCGAEKGDMTEILSLPFVRSFANCKKKNLK